MVDTIHIDTLDSGDSESVCLTVHTDSVEWEGESAKYYMVLKSEQEECDDVDNVLDFTVFRCYEPVVEENDILAASGIETIRL